MSIQPALCCSTSDHYSPIPSHRRDQSFLGGFYVHPRRGALGDHCVIYTACGKLRQDPGAPHKLDNPTLLTHKKRKSLTRGKVNRGVPSGSPEGAQWKGGVAAEGRVDDVAQKWGGGRVLGVVYHRLPPPQGRSITSRWAYSSGVHISIIGRPWQSPQYYPCRIYTRQSLRIPDSYIIRCSKD